MAALAALPAWVCAGLAVARLLGVGAVTTLVLAAMALGMGALVASAAAPHLQAWWALVGASSALVVLGGTLVATRLLVPSEPAVLGGWQWWWYVPVLLAVATVHRGRVVLLVGAITSGVLLEDGLGDGDGEHVVLAGFDLVQVGELPERLLGRQINHHLVSNGPV